MSTNWTAAGPGRGANAGHRGKLGVGVGPEGGDMGTKKQRPANGFVHWPGQAHDQRPVPPWPTPALQPIGTA